MCVLFFYCLITQGWASNIFLIYLYANTTHSSIGVEKVNTVYMIFFKNLLGLAL